MNNAVKTLLAFSLGAATGSLVAWKMLKTKYERIIQEDIDAYRAYADAKIAAAIGDEKTEEKQTEEATDDSDEEDPMAPLSNLIGRYTSNADRREDDKFVREPYVISPEEYDTLDEYECTSLTYHSDGILCDEWDNIIENPDDLVGEGFETHFGEYEDDSIFIRNEGLKRDFEILRDLEAYAELHDRHDDTEE